MADILIRGIEMPTEDSILMIEIFSDGTVSDRWIGTIKGAKAEQLPPHGDLIDRDEYRMSLDKTLIYENDIGKDEGIKIGLQKAYSRLVDAPVIVPAEREEHND